MNEANHTIEQLQHNAHHLELLLSIYSDLKVILDGNNISYYSTIANTQVDQFDIKKDNLSSYIYVYCSYPYKKIKIDCNLCGGDIIINANPHRIPIVCENETKFGHAYIWYGLAYEELLKANNFHPSILSGIQLFLLQELKDRSKLNMTVNIDYLNQSVKKLIPFT